MNFKMNPGGKSIARKMFLDGVKKAKNQPRRDSDEFRARLEKRRELRERAKRAREGGDDFEDGFYGKE